MVLDSPNMEFLFGLDMLRKHQVAPALSLLFDGYLDLSLLKVCLDEFVLILACSSSVLLI